MTSSPSWLDTAEYPFPPRFFELEEGRMHYIDEGRGRPLVFVHGTPTWSFEWRHLVKALSSQYRCLAPDHLGFGLSDKPAGIDYRPEAHARRFAAWMRSLDLDDITFVLHDFGGPIGLAYGFEHIQNVRSVIVLNSWLWNSREEKSLAGGARLLANPLGRFLYERANLEMKVILPAAYGDKRKLTPAVYRHYLAPFDTPSSRAPMFALLCSLLDSSDWFGDLWKRRDALGSKPMLLVWGDSDPVFGPKTLHHWHDAFPGAECHSISGAGHWPHEEEPDKVTSLIAAFLART
ncbi:MAG: alpha/beta fold hydrolase [Akkermansiaceae bacterium]|nr:alpha/beta fold hydrolase [Armatimonadota bacterium]